MRAGNEIHRAVRWSCLAIGVTGCIIFGSCVSSTLNTTRSSSITAGEAYGEITAIAQEISNSDEPTAHAELIEKSRTFIQAYPKYRQVDEIYYLLGNSLIHLERTQEAIEIFEEFISYYPTASYVGESLLTLGLAYDSIGEHEKAEPLYEKLVNQSKYRGERSSEIAQQLLEQDRASRTDELANLSRVNQRSTPNQFINKPASDFQVTDLKGEALALKDYQGQVVLLDFWATWCPPCIAEMPNVKKTYEKYKKQKFQIIGISLDRSKAPLKAYIER